MKEGMPSPPPPAAGAQLGAASVAGGFPPLPGAQLGAASVAGGGGAPSPPGAKLGAASVAAGDTTGRDVARDMEGRKDMASLFSARGQR